MASFGNTVYKFLSGRSWAAAGGGINKVISKQISCLNDINSEDGGTGSGKMNLSSVLWNEERGKTFLAAYSILEQWGERIH